MEEEAENCKGRYLCTTYLHAAFSRLVIHRDVKPSNLLLDKDFVPKLCDFSLSVSIPEGEMGVEDQLAGQ